MEKYIIQNLEIFIDESNANVFNPHPITTLLANSIEVNSNDKVLEIGSGSGLIAITAAKLGANQVIASDISSISCKSIRKNTKINGLNGELVVVEGDMFEPVLNKQFDVIISNPPCMPFPNNTKYINDGLTLAVHGGRDGTQSMLKFINAASKYLSGSGMIYIPVPKWSNWKKLMITIRQKYNYSIINYGEVPFYLAEYSSEFYDHIMKLLKKGLVELKSKNGRLIAEIQILKLTMK